MKRKTIISIFLFFSILITSITAFKKSKESNDNVIRIGYQVPTAVTWGASIMKSRHLVEKELKQLGVNNYKVEWKIAQSGAPLVNLMKSNKLDIAFLGDMPAIITLSDTKKNYIYNPILIGADGVGKNGNGQWIVTKKQNKIKTVNDLKNKSIATAYGSSTDRLIREVLHNSKVKAKLNYTDLSIAKMNLDKGNVDAISVWTPYTILTNSKNYRVVYNGNQSKRDYLGLVVGNKNTINNKKVALAIKIALQKSHNYIEAHPKQASIYLSKDTGFSKNITFKAIQSLEYSKIHPKYYSDSIKSNFIFLKTNNLLKEKKKWSSFEKEYLH